MFGRKLGEHELVGNLVFASGDVAVYYDGSATFDVYIRCAEQRGLVRYVKAGCWTTAAPEKLPEPGSDRMRDYCRGWITGLGLSRYLG